ncbi:hypothetical protein NMY22_g16250 [Coprinellus aureogranulatus]|nr:hypothetical protein NMY22_g16250 [Coprinellus aureogranulatus]
MRARLTLPSEPREGTWRAVALYQNRLLLETPKSKVVWDFINRSYTAFRLHTLDGQPIRATPILFDGETYAAVASPIAILAKVPKLTAVPSYPPPGFPRWISISDISTSHLHFVHSNFSAGRPLPKKGRTLSTGFPILQDSAGVRALPHPGWAENSVGMDVITRYAFNLVPGTDGQATVISHTPYSQARMQEPTRIQISEASTDHISSSYFSSSQLWYYLEDNEGDGDGDGPEPMACIYSMVSSDSLSSPESQVSAADASMTSSPSE